MEAAIITPLVAYLWCLGAPLAVLTVAALLSDYVLPWLWRRFKWRNPSQW